MKLRFLGTGAGVPSKPRNVSAAELNLVNERGTTWLFDCGEATQHQIMHTNLRPRRIEKIFITHMHGDHIFGLPGLLGSRSFQGGETQLDVYGPVGIKKFIETSLKMSCTHLKYQLHIQEIESGDVFEDDQFRVEARRLEHGIPSFGYAITEKDQPGPLLANKLKEMGIKPGPIYEQIKNNEYTYLEDGTCIRRTDVTGPVKKGRKITYLGDTRKCRGAVELAMNSNILVHEATFAHEDNHLAYDYFHSTAVQAAEVAKEAYVKKLILNHISSRYHGEASNVLLEEARLVFEHTDLAEDFSEYTIE